MTQNFFTPIVNGDPRKNDAAIWNEPMGELDAAIIGLEDELRDEIDAIILGSGSSPAEVIAARTAIRYKVSSPPPLLGDTVEMLGANTILVDAYGALGDGTTNDAPAIALAFAAAIDGDTIVFSAGRSYKLGATVTFTKRGRIVGNGATLDCTTLDATALIISTSGRVTIDGLRFLGPVNLSYPGIPTTYTNSRALELLSGADRNTVVNCYFAGFMKGGIFCQSEYNAIANNHFEEVRHYNTDYIGVIYLTSSDYNTVMGNVLEKVWDTGIQVRAGFYNTIVGNQVLASPETAATDRVGLRASAESGYNKFIGNTVKGVGQEGITITGVNATLVTGGNVISGNTLIDCRRAGVTLNPAGGGVGTEQYCMHNIIANNLILAQTKTCSFGILLTTGSVSEVLEENQISNNIIVGITSGGTSQLDAGIYCQGAGVNRNTISGNRIKNMATYGMFLTGIRSMITNNIINICGSQGLRLSGMQYAMAANNIVVGRPTAMMISGNCAGLIIEDNLWDVKLNLSGPTGAYHVRHNKHTATVMFGTATLVAGTVTISPTGVETAYSEGIVEVWRKSFGGTPGAPYVSTVNQATGAVVIKSTSASDTGDIYWQITR